MPRTVPVKGTTSLTEVKGLSELLAELEKLPDRLENEMVGRALNIAAAPMVNKVRSNLRGHVVTGSLLDTVGMRRQKPKKRNQVTVLVTAGGREKTLRQIVRKTFTPNPYWLEFGTAAHHIAAKPGGPPLHLYGNVLVQSVEHPGAQAYPFMRPAFDATVSESIELFRSVLHDLIEQHYGRIPASKIVGL